ncbi:PREDICTED: myosin-binding protein 2-like isoform X2 [Nicotiana attenuata]|uniref:myosin-binding protein 2-like isoform X2 n=1 Tax=Nicotiana attenuata TaxID=49451 RepID=UPI0009053B1E|nr:PREDICTED: myosin-binding protein 2-like isoform X2 [Nicotiana attenuata]
MGANKFATMLYRNTNKITLILIYAVLEWTLIVLLLLNSLFSYLIIKFAEYFGLKPPCLWCSRVDHLFDHRKNRNIHRDLLCEAHATEVSKLGFCSKHQRLAESQDTCEDCSSARPGFLGVSDNFAFFPWIKMIENGKEMTLENGGEVALNCSCCGASLETKFSTPYMLIKPCWDDLQYTHKGNLIIEANDLFEKGDDLDQNRSDYAARDEDKIEKNGDSQLLSSDVKKLEGEKVHLILEEVTEYKEKMLKDEGVQACEIEDVALEIPPQHLEFFIDCSGHMLVPVELIHSANEEDESRSQEKDENQDVKEEVKAVVEEEAEVCLGGSEREPEFAVVSMENDLVFYAKEVYEQFAIAEEASRYHQVQILAAKEREEEKEENSDVSPEVSEMPNNETDGEVSIGTEIPDLDQADEALTSYIHEQPSGNSAHFHQVQVYGHKEYQETEVELRTLSVDLSGHRMNNPSSICSSLNETEENKVPDTPTSTDSFHQKLLLVEKKDSDSLDGSVVSELESGDTISTVEHLKSALKAERKALHSLYTELEEERSASAVAASQTMAMINRLQEEKAAMQMEALQYQRMMEEQSEYDQEALQLMNELMVKREREKQELEKELEAYRKRLLEYEAKEKMRMLKRSKDSSTYSSEDSDGLSIDLNQEAKEDDSFFCHQQGMNHSTPVGAVINLEESLVDFEEERMAILEQLKILEERLVSLDDEDAKHFEDVRLMEDSYQDNGNHIEEDSHANGFFKEINGKHHHIHERRIVIAKGKRLLPLFDSMSDENGDGTLNGVHDFDLENKKLAVEQELDHLHERLQSLEADREFLKNCVSSLKKGDKGMDLLQEILQHLRDLRNVELRARSLSDGTIL